MPKGQRPPYWAQTRPMDLCGVGNVTIIAKTDQAMLCRPEVGEEFWVPHSQVPFKSPVNDFSEVGDSGELIITRWFAKKQMLGNVTARDVGEAIALKIGSLASDFRWMKDAAVSAAVKAVEDHLFHEAKRRVEEAQEIVMSCESFSWQKQLGGRLDHLVSSTGITLCKSRTKNPHWTTDRCFKHCKRCVETAIDVSLLQADKLPWKVDHWMLLNTAMPGVGTQDDALIILFPGNKAYRYPKKATAYDKVVDTAGQIFFKRFRKKWLYYEKWDGKEWVHDPKRRVDTGRQGKLGAER